MWTKRVVIFGTARNKQLYARAILRNVFEFPVRGILLRAYLCKVAGARAEHTMEWN